MKFIDIVNPDRINHTPDAIVTLFSGKNYLDHGFIIKKIELRQFVEKTDEKLGPYSLITSLVDTDKGSIEMLYDEGYLDENSLNKAKELLISNLGMSGLILRSIISLKSSLKID